MTRSTTKAAWARGGTVFAATVMLVIGIYQIFMGIAAIIEDQFFVVGPNYAYNIDTTAWGWIHLGIGALAAVTGFFLFTGATWARVVGIALAVISATANFFFLPYYPIWSLVIIALDVFVIWAIANAPSGAALEDRYDAGMQTGYAGETAQDRERWAATNTTAGRHWAPEPAKDTGTRSPAEATREHAQAMSGSGQMGQPSQPGQPGQPGMGQPGMGQPGTGQSGMGQPGTGSSEQPPMRPPAPNE
jgi:hypothetical protein